MYLKNIEVQGFKSFANKTDFQFHNGITGIVGPNGSGKSNVADAVRWVLGEQRVKQLRGGSMQDVIFAGTAARKPLGYASVAITLDNSDHVLPISYDEVTVTRRLYRSGESEYLINGTACRLKDINEMFYDTGIGKEGYSIIGQGQVERILSGKPEERRELFDEAAGIVKYKRRKYEASRKLSNEQQNLARVSDIISELDRQLGPLHRQSEKAKVYLAKRDELKAYDVNLFLTEIQDMKDRLATLQENHEIVENSLAETKEQAEEIRTRYEEASNLLEALEKEQSALQESLSGAQLQKASYEHQIELLGEQAKQALLAAEAASARLEAIAGSLKQNEETLLAQEQGAIALREHADGLRSEAEALEAQQLSVRKEAEEVSAAIEDKSREQIELLNERARIKTKAAQYDTMLEQIRIRSAQLSSRLLDLKSEGDIRGESMQKMQEEVDRISGIIASLEEKSRVAGEQLQARQETLTELNAGVEQEQAAYHRESSRLESLKNIAERYDGYGNAIRRVMECKTKEPGICGVVADLITTQQKYEVAIETALGGSIQNIVTDDEETAKRLIAYLKENRYGRATFLPLTAMKKAEPFKHTTALNKKGVMGLASTLVKTQPRYAALVSYLLGRTLVVDNIDHAVALAREFKYQLRIVTMEGELLSPGGSMTGGAFKNTGNLLGRRREIEELEKAVAAKKDRLEKLRISIDECRSERNALRDEIRELSGKLQDQYLAKNTAQMKLGEIRSNRDQTERSIAEARAENSENAKAARELERDREKTGTDLSGSEDREQEILAESEALKNRLDALRASESELSADLEALHLQIAGDGQKEEFLLQEGTRIRSEMEALKKEREDILSARDDEGENEKKRLHEIGSLKQQVEESEKTCSEIAEKIAGTQAKRDELAGKQKAFFDEREQISERSGLLDREFVRITSQMERLEETREQRINYMWEEYELTYNNALSLKRDDLGSKTNWRKQMAQLRREIKELGNVNVNAIEEYKEVSERHAFYHEQQDDLIKAEEALRKIIAELDTGMRKKFREQFAKINEEFDRSFKQLFGGGQGTLELVDDEDILEAGIRIIAQPPGKKLQNMMQLSGGEKSLTAIALLFAIQNLKPSPFCLLDEIEAALDESNVERYASYLRKLTKNTQFIIITHRRGTMAAADRLYGVTMQEKGVSALVSVDLVSEQLDA